MKVKSKTLLTLKKLVSSQREKYGITENFSYRFDYRTKKLILCYYVPLVVKQNGKIKNKMMKMERYYKDINESNYKRYFKGDTTLVKDDALFVKQQIKEYDTNYGLGDEYDFKWWVENYLSRSIGKTKTIIDVQSVATPQLLLERGDILVLYGANKDIRKFINS